MFLKHYQNIAERLEREKNNMLQEMTRQIQKHNEPIAIGNMVYWITTYNNQIVPGYRYQNDQTNTFLPIYDREQTFEFGWTDFNEVCRIFDVILKHLVETK